MIQSVLLLEDHKDTRTWFCELLTEAYPGCSIQEAGTIQRARELIAASSFDLGIIDINLPDGNGIEIVKELSLASPDTYVVVATIFDDKHHIFESLKAGAQGYLNKYHNKEQFLSRLEGILNGDPPLSPAIARCIIEEYRSTEAAVPESSLTKREKEVLALVAKGMSRSDIANLLEISVHTVVEHIKNIYRKLNVGTTAEAALEALRLGLVQIKK